MQIESPERFQLLCSRLARREFPNAMPVNFSSWDGGRDILLCPTFDKGIIKHDTVWQVKFTRNLGATTKRAIQESIASITNQDNMEIAKWILCMPVEPTGKFLNWLATQIPTNWEWQVWGKAIITELLEKNPDITHAFFYPVYEELRNHFAVENLELERFILDPSCEWKQPDSKILHFYISNNVASPDFILDIIVKNTGESDALLQALEVDFIEWEPKMHGIPGEKLLYPQITYKVSINHGKPALYRTICEPPLIVTAKSFERFKICICDTGYAWRGTITITLDYGREKRLCLPYLRLYA